ncbi:hypothetical protein HHI36_012828, partial [Cryptolaemus montrouzieri]
KFYMQRQISSDDTTPMFVFSFRNVDDTGITSSRGSYVSETRDGREKVGYIRIQRPEVSKQQSIWLIFTHKSDLVRTISRKQQQALYERYETMKQRNVAEEYSKQSRAD